MAEHRGGNFKNDPQRASEAGKKVAKIATVVDGNPAINFTADIS